MNVSLDTNANGDAAGTPSKEVVDEDEGEPAVRTEPETSTENRHPSAVVSPGRASAPVVVLIDDSEGDNPQEPSTPQSPESEPSDVTSDHQDRASSEADTSVGGTILFKGRKRRRHVAVVNEDASGRRLLPANQYETILRRRAIRKREDESKPVEHPPPIGNSRSIFGTKVDSKYQEEALKHADVVDEYDEDYGDISVGMKLNIIAGKVIVQGINSLSDGRASPAQLTGLIHRGDVLLSIDNVSLVNLPIDQLMEGLKPLSSPQSGNAFKRSLHLRFAAGEGLKLLGKNETAKKAGDEAAKEISALSQYMSFVDQLSGVPMFEDQHETIIPEEPVVATAVEPAATPPSVSLTRMNRDELISMDVAERRKMDRLNYVSEFFTWNDHFSRLLRASVMQLVSESEDYHMPLTLSEMIEAGEKAMAGAKKLFYGMEDVDKGKDTRSFKQWNSTLSLRSRASARRRLVLEYAPIDESISEEEYSDDGSAGSGASGEPDEVAGDELLLQLAAHDEIWRRNVIEVLQSATKEIEAEERKQNHSEHAPTNVVENPSFESLLFGEQVSNMLTAKKKSYALPPEDVTSVLFDLVTNLTVTPDEISLKGSSHHVPTESSIVPFHRLKHNDDILLAAQFLVSEAFPAWLKSFRPLPWEQRRVLWPEYQRETGSSLAGASHVYEDDVLTQDSASTGYPSPYRRQQKNLRQQIEELELNSETRAETCFLVTFYFTQEILPSLAMTGSSKDDATKLVAEAVEFVKAYGAYLRLHVSLAHAAIVKADEVIECLLALSRHDPRHRQAMKELSKASSLVLYEPAMLSAILVRLRRIREEQKSEHRRDMMNICVSAYPDLRPWQVREACTGAGADSSKEEMTTNEEFEAMYYDYLSLLLHPSEGHDAARRDQSLVKEWCEISIQSVPRLDVSTALDAGAKETARRGNFYRVASRASSDHRFYRRDLLVLTELSIQGEEWDLALALIDEMLDNTTYASDTSVMSSLLSKLQMIAKDALCPENASKESMDMATLKRILRLFDKMATKKVELCRKSIAISHELCSLLQACQDGAMAPTEKEIAFVNMLATNGTPDYALETVALWATDHPTASNVIPALHILLQRGAQNGIKNELSGSLFRVRQSRLQSQVPRSSFSSSGTSQFSYSGDTNVWRRMFDGSVAIEK